MRSGDRSVNVYWACTTTAATPIPAANTRSSSKSLTRIRFDFDRLPRALFGTVPVRDIGWHLYTADTLAQRHFAKIVEWTTKEKDVAEACIGQITTTVWQTRLSGSDSSDDPGGGGGQHDGRALRVPRFRRPRDHARRELYAPRAAAVPVLQAVLAAVALALHARCPE